MHYMISHLAILIYGIFLEYFLEHISCVFVIRLSFYSFNVQMVRNDIEIQSRYLHFIYSNFIDIGLHVKSTGT